MLPTTPFSKPQQDALLGLLTQHLQHANCSHAFVLRVPRIISGGTSHTNKPDGMFVRTDGLFTDHRGRAAIFYSKSAVEAATLYLRQNGCTLPIYTVQVEIQPTIKSIGKTTEVSRVTPEVFKADVNMGTSPKTAASQNLTGDNHDFA